MLFLLVGTTVYSQEPPPPAAQGQPRESPPKRSTTSNIKANNNDNATQNRMPKIVPKIHADSSNASPKNAYEKNSERRAGTTKDDPITTYTLLLMIFTGLLVVCNIFLWLSTKKSADAAKKSADVLASSERAFLHIVVYDDNIRELTNKHFVKYQIRNYGKTPAIVKEISHCIKWDKTLPNAQVYNPSGLVLKEHMISAKDSTDDITCEFRDSVDFMKSVEAFNKGESSAWFYGRVVYDDIFGNRHEHRFVWRHNTITKGLLPCHGVEYSEYNKNT